MGSWRDDVPAPMLAPLYIKDGRDQQGTVDTGGPMLSHESEFSHLNDPRLCPAVQMQDDMGLLEWERAGRSSNCSRSLLPQEWT